jgi:ferritin-like metal-binding protein YciE
MSAARRKTIAKEKKDMPIKTMEEMFMHELGDIYDAEHQFLRGQEEMLEKATDPTLKEMLTNHITETEGQIETLKQVFAALGEEPKREPCSGARGLVSEAKKMLEETTGAPKVRDCAIASSAEKVEHYEICAYKGLIDSAELMEQREVVSLLQKNLEQEEATARLIEENSPALLEKAITKRDMAAKGAQATPTC